MPARRVASGQDKNGKAVVVSDEIVAGVPLGGGAEILPVWGADTPPSFPLNGSHPGYANFFPGLGGYRFLLMTIPPQTGDLAQDSAAPQPPFAEDLQRLGKGMHEVMEQDTPGMHTTDTVDLEVVLAGEASLELDDGKTVHLGVGDCYIQNGTRHRWFNRGSVAAVVAVVMVGGHPRA